MPLSKPQKRTPKTKPPLEAWLGAFQAGIRHFNAGKFFEAHEVWEKDWRKIPDPDRAQTQGAILVCGVFVLIGKGRLDPAERLALLALERFAEAATQSRLLGRKPVLEIQEVEESLMRVLAAFRVGESDPGHYVQYTKGLKAKLRGLPRTESRRKK